MSSSSQVLPPDDPRLRWSTDYVRRHPFKTAAITLVLVGRYLFALVFLYGFAHKVSKHWLWSPTLRQHFVARLAEIDPASFQAAYLRNFAIPWYLPTAWVLTIGQLLVSVSMLLGLAVRPHAALALFLVLNISAGSFYNASMPPFIFYSLLLMGLPSGHWLGLDGLLHRRYPRSIWFR